MTAFTAAVTTAGQRPPSPTPRDMDMTDHQEPTRRAAQTKYTILLDPATRAYQRHLRRHTNVNFSDVLRALVARIASDKELEAAIFAEVGGGYDDYEERTATPLEPATESPLVAEVAEAEAGQGAAVDVAEPADEPVAEVEAALEPADSIEPGGFWGDEDIA